MDPINTNPDELFTCPYDPVHRVAAKRFPYHLMKCRKIHSAGDYDKCPFNARHEMPRQELEYHITICPDKDVIRQDVEATPAEPITSSYRPATPPPSQGIGADHSEDWDSEAVNEPFIPSNAVGIQEEVDSYAVIQTLQEVQEEIHGPAKPPPANLADMTPSQRKNFKRRQQKRSTANEENGEEVPQIDDEQRLAAIIKKYALLSGRETGSFVDFVSILNQHCQLSRINSPKYCEGPGVAGGFGCVCVVMTYRFGTKKHCKTKKEAKQNSAMVALLGLNISVGIDPTPCKATGPRSTSEKERMRQTHEQQLLSQAGYNHPRSVLQPPSSFASAPQTHTMATAPPLRTAPPAGSQGLDQTMDGLSISHEVGNSEQDGWTTVPNKKGPAGVKNPIYNYSLKVAGRGRGMQKR